MCKEIIDNHLELFRMVYESRGIQVMFEIVSYVRATNMVQQKQADVSVGVYLNEYDNALFSEWPYLQDVVLAIFKKGKVTAWEGEKSLSGLKMLEHDRLDFFLDMETELREALQEGYIDVDAF